MLGGELGRQRHLLGDHDRDPVAVELAHLGADLVAFLVGGSGVHVSPRIGRGPVVVGVVPLAVQVDCAQAFAFWPGRVEPVIT